MTIFLGPGDYFFGSTSEQISTLLGSCVSLVAWLPERQLLSVSHVMLPALLIKSKVGWSLPHPPGGLS